MEVYLLSQSELVFAFSENQGISISGNRLLPLMVVLR